MSRCASTVENRDPWVGAPARGPQGRLACRAAIALLLVFSAASAVPLSDIVKYFQWGEYDTIIARVEPFLQSASDTLDSVSRAEYHKFLGVAYFSKGRVGEAGEQFTRAYEYDPGVSLDPDYVTAAIHDLFLSTRQEMLRRTADLARRDSIAQAEKKQIERTAAARAEAERLRARRRVEIALGFSAAALSAFSAGVSAYEYRAADRYYEQYRDAAAGGDLREYRRLGDSVAEADRWTVVAGGAGIVFAGVAVVCARVSRKTGKKIVERLSWSLEEYPNGLCWTVEF